uniref:F-box domain-containing protein n=1 Tax=Ditylenchus dipsaci TaxID=166011 RepID=A0A915DBA0_9BILA
MEALREVVTFLPHFSIRGIVFASRRVCIAILSVVNERAQVLRDQIAMLPAEILHEVGCFLPLDSNYTLQCVSARMNKILTACVQRLFVFTTWFFLTVGMWNRLMDYFVQKRKSPSLADVVGLFIADLNFADIHRIMGSQDFGVFLKLLSAVCMTDWVTFSVKMRIGECLFVVLFR